MSIIFWFFTEVSSTVSNSELHSGENSYTLPWSGLL